MKSPLASAEVMAAVQARSGLSVFIAREAGAAVSDAFGAPLAYNKRDPRAFGLLAAAPARRSAPEMSRSMVGVKKVVEP